MRRSNQQASRRTPSSPSSSSSQGSNAWVNRFSQGGVGSTGSNYMTPRGEYISRPPCSRVTLQTGTSYPNTDKVIHECILLVSKRLTLMVVGVVSLDERDPYPVLQPIAAAEKIYFFQLTRHLQINLFQLGLRFIYITLHLTTFINVTSQPHLWSIVSVQWLRCIRCLGTDSSQLGRCRQYGFPWGTGAAYIIIFKNSGNKIKIPMGARRS